MRGAGIRSGGKPHLDRRVARIGRHGDSLPATLRSRCGSATRQPITSRENMDPNVDVADAPPDGARTLNGHPPRAGAMDPGVERRDTTPFVERTPVRSPFPPLADYGFLSDCHTGALVAPDGTVEWLCPPRFDAPSVFGAILDRSAGGFRLGPSAMGSPAGRRYEPGTMILETTWMTPTGWLVVRDALVIGRWRERTLGTTTAHTRPPTDYEAHHALVRTITCIHGQAQIELLCEPMFDYGRVPATWSTVAGAPGALDATGGPHTVRLMSDLKLGIEGGCVRARHRLERGETRFCALSWSRLLDGPRATQGGPRAPATTRGESRG